MHMIEDIYELYDRKDLGIVSTECVPFLLLHKLPTGILSISSFRAYLQT